MNRFARSLSAGAAARRIIRFRDGHGEVHLAHQPVESGPATLLSGDIFEPLSLRELGPVILDDCTLLAPVEPPVVLATGLNYHQHAVEVGMAPPKAPILAFLKTASSVQHPGHPIMIPAVCNPAEPEVDWEVELAVVIGKHCKDATLETALDFVLGYTCANDVSARRWQTDPELSAGQWNRGKGFDTFCPLGPALVLNERGFDPHSLRLSLSVNEEVMQDSNTSDLIHGVAEIVTFLSQDTTLLPGTLILTGTPSGIGHAQTPPRYLAPGDVVSASIDSIGTLTNPVIDAPKRAAGSAAGSTAGSAVFGHPGARSYSTLAQVSTASAARAARSESRSVSPCLDNAPYPF